MKTIYNIDKIKICLNQSDDFFNDLYNTIKNVDKQITIHYDGFYLSINEGSVSDKDITAKLFIEEGQPFELGTFVFNNSSKYGKKSFFSFSSKSLYECSGYVPTYKHGMQKYNYFSYPFYAFQILGLEFNNITTVEIACDTEASVINKIQYAVSHPEAFDMILLWKKVENPDEILDGFWEFYQRSRIRKASHPTLYVHSTSYDAGNNKGLKIYDKARELAQARPDKEELTRAWNDMRGNIQRLEITVENKQFKRFYEDLCKKYSDNWYCSSRMKTKSKEERAVEYKKELGHFFFDLGTDEKYRKIMFDYFAYRLLHFKCRNRNKIQFTLSDLIDIPKSVLINEVSVKNSRVKGSRKLDL